MGRDPQDREEVGAEATVPDQKLSFILATRAREGLLNLQLERTPSAYSKRSGVKPQGTGSSRPHKRLQRESTLARSLHESP